MFITNHQTSNCKFKALLLALCFIFFCSISARASVRNYKIETDGVTFWLDKGSMKIKVCRANIIQVQYSILNAPPLFNSLVVNNKFNAPIKFKVTQSGQYVVINTGSLILKIDKNSNAIAYYTPAGKLITSEDKGQNKVMKAQVVAGKLFNKVYFTC
jgi:alpha-D-xyloside xylohydrolase